MDRRKKRLIVILGLAVSMPVFSQTDGTTPIGANTAMSLYGHAAGKDYVTSQGGAPVSALNPAANGDAQRIVFDLGYLGLPGLGDESKYGNALNLGALFPSRYGVFGGSLRFIQSPFNDFPVETTFGGSLNAAKELYPGMSVGAGFNFGFGNDWTLSADLGFRYNMGTLGPLEDFTWAVVLRSMGKSWISSMFTPVGGVSFDFFRIRRGDGPSPLKIGFAMDLGFPTFQNMEGRAGLNFVIADLITLGTSTRFNIRESAGGHPPSPVPSLGISANFKLKSGGRRLVAGTLPSDGELAAALGIKPLYNGVYAMGGGVTWTVGVADKTPPVIIVDYPETVYFSPNNDGLADDLEFPVTITDQRYIAEWSMEIRDESGNVVRTYRNKERRPETQGVQNILNRLRDVKSGVEVPPAFRWDGYLDAGTVAEDGRYFFTITAADDNGNTAVTETFETVVDNTHPVVEISPLGEGMNIFSPDGDGNKDTLALRQSGSTEDLWDAGIYDAQGTRIRDFSVTNGAPEPLVWDGKDDAGHFVADGVYSYRISATDRAKNSESASLENIIVSTVQPAVNLTIGDAWFSPNGDGVKDTVALGLLVPVREGIVGWELRIIDSAGSVRRSITGNAAPPPRVEFDGKSGRGSLLPEGVYTGNLAVSYRNGFVSTSSSPAFTLDITAPLASVRIDDPDQEPGKPPVFSPNNDGNKDELVILQEGSNETAWTGEVRRSGAPPGSAPVKTFRFSGVPSPRLLWDGVSNSGALAPDGFYTYELYTTDPAGNTGRSAPAEFQLFTRDTPVLLAADLRAFSPNGDGVKDTINLNPQLQESAGVLSWKIDIESTALPGTPVRTIEGRNAPPASVAWNGRDNGGAVVPDGSYLASIEVRYSSGNQPRANSLPFVVDTEAPKAEISVPFTSFSPSAESRRNYLPITITTPGRDEWTGVITGGNNIPVKTWTWTGSPPERPLIWNGTDEAGNVVPNGAYTFTLRSTDEAGNSARETVGGIVVDARVPRVFLTASAQGIAPRANDTADPMRFNIILNPPEGIESWQMELRDERGTLTRTFSSAGVSGAPPGFIGWNGTNDQGVLREGRYTPLLTVNYAKGDVVTASAPPVTVDVTGPRLGFSSRPEYFSPDNDGVDDELIMNLSAVDLSPIANWSLEIRETEGTKQLFYRIEGRGSPSERIVWDGRSNRGELVQAATDYRYIYRAADSLGNASSIEGIISVDVLVIRDGDKLRIQVPSIVFRSNGADFDTLPDDVKENNYRVLRRIAEILNKFRDYRITVEGHANPVLRTQAEEINELRPLSLARAQAVVDQLGSFGVTRSRLNAIGMGGARTVADPADENNRWKNRRVEFILIK
jgi:outer membrane protein OmpA-like peptidoglycan-associated protein/flagellar hook assembly protein FlgD